MKELHFDVPALYGDHHVLELRKILSNIDGIIEIYASSAFHMIEMTIDDSHVTLETIEDVLKQTGYLDELPIISEMAPVKHDGLGKIRRTTTTYDQTPKTISFNQAIHNRSTRAWSCPGMGMIQMRDE